MSFNAEYLNYFKRINANERLAHAYLFCGPGGSGKSSTAYALAKMLNCELADKGSFDSAPTEVGASLRISGVENRHPLKLFCGECGSCRKITSGNHPDILLIEAGVGETIKIEEIRTFIQRSGLRSFEAQWKVFLIKNAERLTKEAANALLKTLEEPNKQTLMVLTTSSPELCLDTIRSRCQTVSFYPKSQEAITQDLMQTLALDQTSAQTLAYFSEGSLSKAKELYEEKFAVKKNKVIDEIVMKRNSEEFLRKVLSDKEETQTALKVLLSFFRDIILVKSGVGVHRLANCDRARDVRTLSGEFSFDEAEGIFGQIVKTMKLLKDNLNVKMSLSVLKEMVFK